MEFEAIVASTLKFVGGGPATNTSPGLFFRGRNGIGSRQVNICEALCPGGRVGYA